ncbi:hypothetical protein ACFU93_42170 [Streptomyces sp. NPDC057611]|uniref:hypothetical protein n=1 Tax=Streptomyces sp. NPDC057611 TaxID=3346182 RepID=UPI0036BFAA52
MRLRRRLIALPVIAVAALSLLAPSATAAGQNGELRPGERPVSDIRPAPPAPSQTREAAAQAQAALPQIPDVPPLSLENGSVDVDSGPSLAAKPLTAQPVGPGTLPTAIPAGNVLTDRVSADALRRLDSLGLTSSGQADPKTTKLLPATAGAPLLDVGSDKDAKLTEFGARVKDWSGVDPVQLLKDLPRGLPGITYRLCAQSASRPVACSLQRPLVVPVLADVTGDGTPDVLADVLPAVDVQTVLSLSGTVSSLQSQVDAINQRITELRAILADPLQVILHPAALVELLHLSSTLGDVQAQLTQRTNELSLKVAAGLGVLSARLPTGDTAGKPLKAQVWAEYDIPVSLDFKHTKRLSVGFDGYRRGTGLSTVDWGIYTADIGAALDGVADVTGRLCHFQPADSIGTVLGLADAGADGNRDSIEDPVVANVLQTPVPERFTAQARIELDTLQARVDLLTSAPTTVDALAVSNQTGGTDRAIQVIVDKLPLTTTAELTRPKKDGSAKVHFTSSSSILKAAFHDHTYRSGELQKTMSGAATELPTTADLTVVNGEAEEGENKGVASVSYEASQALARTVDAQYFDRAAGRTIAEAQIRDLPAKLTLTANTPGHRLDLTTSAAIGSIAALYQRGGGAIARPDGDHATYQTAGAARGASARISGLTGLAVQYGAHPHAVLQLDPGGQPFLAWGSIDGVKLARVDISNLPARVEADLDPAARTAVYQASAKIASLRGAYTDTSAGPTLDVTAKDVPSRIEAAYRLGDTPQAKLTASSSLKQVKGYYSAAPVSAIDPDRGNDVYAEVNDVPTEVTADVNFPAKHLDWKASAEVGSVHAVARTPVGGRDWTFAGKVTGVPATFDADWASDLYRFRGLSGPLGSAHLAATNHPGATSPAGPHLAVHHRAATGDTDASVQVSGLELVQYAPAPDGLDAQFKATSAKMAVDADVIKAADGADDTKLALRGYVGPLPNKLSLTAANGSYTYKGDKPLNIQAQFWAGKVKALSGLGAPRLTNGISAVDSGCTEGAGCARDDGAFCTQDKGCLGVTGIIDVTGLPTEVTANTGAKTFSFKGYTPQSEVLQLYTADRVFSPYPLKALVKVTGLPSEVQDLTVGPMKLGEDFDLAYSSKLEKAGVLDVHAEASGVPKFGDSRLKAHLDPIPGSLRVSGKAGEETNLTVDNSTAISNLDVTVTGTFNDSPASARLDLHQIPATTNWSSSGFGTDKLGMPTVSYDAWDAQGGQGADTDTLDGDVTVEADMVKNIPDVGKVGPDDIQLSFTNLGHHTTVEVDKDEYRAQILSTPKTGRLKIVGNLKLDIPRQEIKDEPFFDCKVVTGRFYGHYGIKPSKIEDITIAANDVKSLNIQPGKARTDLTIPLPQVVGYLFQALDGDYGGADVSFSGVNLNPDIDLYFRIDKIVGPDFFQEHIDLTEPTDTLMFHRYDYDHETEFTFYLNPGNIPVWWYKARPGIAAPPQANSMHVPGGSPQLISFLDPGDKVNDAILAWLAYHVWPYDGEHKPKEDSGSSFC